MSLEDQRKRFKEKVDREFERADKGEVIDLTDMFGEAERLGRKRGGGLI